MTGNAISPINYIISSGKEKTTSSRSIRLYYYSSQKTGRLVNRFSEIKMRSASSGRPSGWESRRLRINNTQIRRSLCDVSPFSLQTSLL